MAKSNTNKKIAFARANGNTAKELTSKYDVTAFPTFISLLNGKVDRTFRGASLNRLQEMVDDLASKIPKYFFKEFKPT